MAEFSFKGSESFDFSQVGLPDIDTYSDTEREALSISHSLSDLAETFGFVSETGTVVGGAMVGIPGAGTVPGATTVGIAGVVGSIGEGLNQASNAIDSFFGFTESDHVQENQSRQASPTTNGNTGSATNPWSGSFAWGNEYNSLDQIAEEAHQSNALKSAADVGSASADIDTSSDPASGPVDPDIDGIHPIIVDLGDDPNGVFDVTGLDQKTAWFDFDSDGFAEQGSWVSETDAFLVLDLSSEGTAGADGQITLARELAFAEWTEDNPDDTDMEAFATLFDKDENGVFNLDDFDSDGTITTQNTTYNWTDFRLWQDFDQDGVVDLKGKELRTLDGLNILGSQQDSTEGGIAFERELNVRAITSIGVRHETENGATVQDHYNSSPEDEAGGNVLHGSASYDYEVSSLDENGDVQITNGTGRIGDASLAHYANGIRRIETNDGHAIHIEGLGYAHFLDLAKQKNFYEAEISNFVNLVSLGVFGALGDEYANSLDASSALYGVVIQGGGGSDTLRGGTSSDVISGDAGADELFGNDGNDAVFFDLDDTHVDGGADDDTAIFLGIEDLTFDLAQHNFEALISGAGHDTILAGSTAQAVTIDGREGSDAITGASGNDLLNGGVGDDTVIGFEPPRVSRRAFGSKVRRL